MTGSASDYLELKLLDHITGKTSYTKPTAYIALLTAEPDDASTGATITEPSASYAYARITTSGSSWAAATGGAVSNAAILTSATASGGDWGTITHFALLDSATLGAGNVLVWGELTTPKTVNSGDSLSFAIGAIVITLD